MVIDKLNAGKFTHNISWFAVFGLLNGACFGLSNFMKEEDYKYYFAYKADGKQFSLIRSQFGCNKLLNAFWTVPILVGCG